jgi:hypothetical protein
MQILCDAVSFGFGPVSKLISLAYALADRHNCTLTFAGKGCSLQLALKCEAFSHHTEVDTTDPLECNKKIGSDITNYDGVLSVMNPDFLKWAQGYDVKTIVVDSLLTMWDEIPTPWLKTCGIIIQNNHGAAERAANELKSNNTLVTGPLLDPVLLSNELRYPHNMGQTILINLGGAEDPISIIPDLIGSVVSKLLMELPILKKFERKLLAVGKRQHSALKRLKNEGFTVDTCGHRQFLKHLANCDVFLTTPGLTGSFEAFCLRAKTCFLPPFNYSQYLNLQTFRRFGAAPLSLHWSDLGVGIELLTPRLPEEYAVSLLEKAISTSLNDTKALKVFRILLDRHISLALSESDQSALFYFQQEYFNQNGKVGTLIAAKYIVEILANESQLNMKKPFNLLRAEDIKE